MKYDDYLIYRINSLITMRDPNFKNPPIKRNKNMANDIMKNYEIDDQFECLLHELEIDQFVADIVEIMIKNSTKEMNGNKDKMIHDKMMTAVILYKQQKIRKNYTDDDDPERKHNESKTMDTNVVKLDNQHQIWWADNMRCIREMIGFGLKL